MRGTTVRDDLGVRAFDVFCPAAFASTLPWIAALPVFLAAGVPAVAGHDQHLVDHLLAGLDPAQYDLVGPRTGPARSTLVACSAQRPRSTAPSTSCSPETQPLRRPPAGSHARLNPA